MRLSRTRLVKRWCSLGWLPYLFDRLLLHHDASEAHFSEADLPVNSSETFLSTNDPSEFEPVISDSKREQMVCHWFSVNCAALEVERMKPVKVGIVQVRS